VIAVTIPTKNSAATIEECLASIAEQNVEVEVVVADDESADGTAELAQAHGARVVQGPLPLLEARYRAFVESSGDPVVLLDSDQVLAPGALGRVLELAREHDVLFLAESSIDESGWLAGLYAADRRLLHALADYHVDPAHGSLLPRVFRRAVLEAAFEQIPSDVRHAAVAQDHLLLYEAVARVTRSTAIVPDAVRHHEPQRLVPLWRKYFRWGVELAALTEAAPATLGSTRMRLRGRLHYRRDAPLADYARSLVLLALKVPPYAAGYGYGLLARRRASRRYVQT
jgi:glycosyltransferase involved in cell wall biosynthesis